MEQPGSLQHLPPLNYVGRVNCVTGYGGAARHQIHVLRSHGLRLRIVDAGSTSDPDPSGETPWMQACRKSDPLGRELPRGTIFHVAPNCLADWRRKLPRPHISVSVWETSRLPAAWVGILNGFDQVWCATEWQAEVYRASGVSPSKVRLVPFAVAPELYPLDGDPPLNGHKGGQKAGPTVFGAVFQWTERKAPAALLGAFVTAFQRGEDVTLRLKVYEGDNPGGGVEAKVREILAAYQLTGPAPRVEVISRRLSHAETLAFYSGLDCYVSSHRGEGFGLPIAEALLLGRQVIATDWSAPAEYAAGLYHPVAYALEAPHSMGWQPFYFADQEWAAPELGSLSAWMQEVHHGRAEAPPRAEVVARFAGLQARAGVAARAALDEVLR